MYMWAGCVCACVRDLTPASFESSVRMTASVSPPGYCLRSSRSALVTFCWGTCGACMQCAWSPCSAAGSHCVCNRAERGLWDPCCSSCLAPSHKACTSQSQLAVAQRRLQRKLKINTNKPSHLRPRLQQLQGSRHQPLHIKTGHNCCLLFNHHTPRHCPMIFYSAPSRKCHF